MKQVAIPAPLQAEIVDAPRPTCGDGDMIVKTSVTGISIGTEMKAYTGDLLAGTEYPLFPGYEAVGVIDQIGENMKGFSLGDRVLCFGPHAQYVKANRLSAVRVPEQVPSEKATLAVLGATAIHAVRRARIQYGDTAVVVGLGVVGLLITQHARLSGARRVIGLDVKENRRGFAQAVGADDVCDPLDEKALERLCRSNAIGADVSFEVAGGSAQAVRLALRMTRENGRVLLMGGGSKGEVRFPYFEDFFRKELEIFASRATGPGWIDFPLPDGIPRNLLRWHSIDNLTESIRCIASGAIDIGCIRTCSFDYRRIADIYHEIQAGIIDDAHIVLDWSSD